MNPNLNEEQFGPQGKNLCPIGAGLHTTWSMADWVGSDEDKNITLSDLKTHAGTCIACRSKREAK